MSNQVMTTCNIKRHVDPLLKFGPNASVKCFSLKKSFLL